MREERGISERKEVRRGEEVEKQIAAYEYKDRECTEGQKPL